MIWATVSSWHPVVDVTGDGSKVWCCKKQYCIGTWNVSSTNQGKLEVIKQEMARVKVDILGISELKWTRVGEFNSDDHYVYYCGQESLRRNGVALIANRSLKCSTWVQSQKWQNDLCSFPKQTIQNNLVWCSRSGPCLSLQPFHSLSLLSTSQPPMPSYLQFL